MKNDSTFKTIVTATLLCVACSVLVSSAAVALKQRQVDNQKLDIKKNLLLASGLISNPKASKEEILKAFDKIQSKIIELETGDEASDIDANSFDQKKAAKDPKLNKLIASKDDLGKIKRRSRYAKTYFVTEDGETKMLVLPIHGKGLWSTLYGFIALSPDTKTIQGLGFYQHGETAGLGGEVDNPKWKASWVGKKALNDSFEPIIEVIKGNVNPANAQAKSQIDGLSGATITSNGVTGLVRYWLGQDGFGPFLEKFRTSGGQL